MIGVVKSLILVLFFGVSCSAYKKTLDNKTILQKIWTKQTVLQKAIEFEKSLNDNYEVLEKNVSLSKSVFPLLDEFQISKPFIVKRKQDGFLPVYAEYFFSEKDSILRYISYDWEKNRYGNYSDKQKMWQEESSKLIEYNQEYEKIKSELAIKLGNPKEEDREPQTKTSKHSGKDYFARSTVWETDEIHGKLTMVFASNTYRIRLNYYWKK